MGTKSIGVSRYFLTFTGDYSRYTMVYFLKEKIQVKDFIKIYKALVENQLNKKIKKIRCDNGKEYINNDIQSFLAEAGILLEPSCPYTPQQNGLSGRKNRTIVEKARCMMLDANLPKCYWAEAVSTAVYLLNRSPNKILNSSTPYQEWFGSKPSLTHLKIFGCRAMVKTANNFRKKWDKKSQEYMFIQNQSTLKTSSRPYNLMEWCRNMP